MEYLVHVKFKILLENKPVIGFFNKKQMSVFALTYLQIKFAVEEESGCKSRIKWFAQIWVLHSAPVHAWN